MRTAPTTDLKVLLGLPPIHFQIEGEAGAVTHKILQGKGPISKLHEAKTAKLCSELQKDLILGTRVDAICQKYD